MNSKDIETLVNNSRSMAEMLLREQQEFYPFGAKIYTQQKFSYANLYDGDEFPHSQSVIDDLNRYLSLELLDKKIIGYAITYNAKVTNSNFPESVSAIIVLVTLAGDDVIQHFFPYKFDQNKLSFFESWSEKQ